MKTLITIGGLGLLVTGAVCLSTFNWKAVVGTVIAVLLLTALADCLIGGWCSEGCRRSDD